MGGNDAARPVPGPVSGHRTSAHLHKTSLAAHPSSLSLALASLLLSPSPSPSSFRMPLSGTLQPSPPARQ